LLLIVIVVLLPLFYIILLIICVNSVNVYSIRYANFYSTNKANEGTQYIIT